MPRLRLVSNLVWPDERLFEQQGKYMVGNVLHFGTNPFAKEGLGVGFRSPCGCPSRAVHEKPCILGLVQDVLLKGLRTDIIDISVTIGINYAAAREIGYAY